MKKGLVWLLLIVLGIWLGVEFAAARLGMWVFYVTGAIVAGLLVWVQLQMRHQRGIITLLVEECDPEAFLTAYEKELSQVKDPAQRDLLALNQASGLCYAGRQQEALRVIRAVEAERLTGIYRAHYYNNLISILILSGKDREALKAYAAGREYLEGRIQNKELALAVKGTLGGVALLNREYGKTRQLFSEVLAANPPRLIQATAHYFLGRAAEEAGDSDEARAEYGKAMNLGGSTLMASEAEARLKGME